MASAETTIEWTDRTWNPTTGCNRVSPGCKFCYAEAVAHRFTNHFPNGFEFTERRERLDQPKRWRKPSRIFVDSMSDLFHEQMDVEYLKDIFAVMAECPRHVFQILTKREKRLAELAPQLDWPENVWMGISVELQLYTKRIEVLRDTPAQVRFLSCEPLLGPLELNLEGIHWVITGGESGLHHRPIKEEWVRSIRDQCLEADVAFFHKQWGGRFPKQGGREVDGVLHDAMPDAWAKHLEQYVLKP